MASLASINIKFSADMKGFSSQMQSAQKQLEKTGKKLQKVGANMTMALTVPLLGLGAASIAAWDKQAKAIAQVDAGLKATGHQAGFTSKQLQKMASDLQNNSLFGDEEILKSATSQLLTFTNIAGEQFARTQQAALDLATRLDGDLQSSSIQLGKALNDPVKNLSALSRAGIQFSEDQKNTINALASTNRLAEAQTIILDELEKQYGGSAEAAAKAGLGPLTQLGNILGDITEDFGKIIVEGIQPFVAYLKDLALSFQDLSPETKKWIVILGGVAAAIGPIVGLAGLVLPSLITGFTLLTGPIGLVIAGLVAIGVVIYKNWEPIKRTLRQIANYFIELYNESMLFRSGVESVILQFKLLFEIGKFIFETLKNIVGGFIDSFVNGFKTVGRIIKAVLTGDLKSIPDIISDSMKDSANVFGEMTGELASDWKTMTANMQKDTDAAIDNIKNKRIELLAEVVVDSSAIDEVSGVPGKKATATTPTASKGPKKLTTEDFMEIDKIQSDLEALNKGLEGIFAATGVNLAMAVEEAQGESMFGGITNQYEKFLEDTDEMLIDPFAEKMERLKEVSELVGESVSGAFESLSGRVVDSLGLANEGFEGFIKGLVSTITKLIAMMLAQSISQAIAGATASGLATGPLAIFTTPGFIATAVGGVLAAFAAIPKFATGGVVGGSSFHGDKILARVNSGELILNKSQQQRVLNAMDGASNIGVTVGGEFKLRGDSLVAVVDRSNQRISRQT